jgi:hypothetical protein
MVDVVPEAVARALRTWPITACRKIPPPGLPFPRLQRLLWVIAAEGELTSGRTERSTI